jgi:hypothetical protein
MNSNLTGIDVGSIGEIGLQRRAEIGKRFRALDEREEELKAHARWVHLEIECIRAEKHQLVMEMFNQ